MKKLLVVLIAAFAACAVASAADYTINDAAIDAAIEASVEISPMDMMASVPVSAPASDSVSSKNDGVAIALTFVLGGLGIHRHYMGTSKWMWAAYTFTFGGIFGVVPLIDLIVEIVGLVDGSGLSQYYGNTKFFMWI